jgi:hypothetical protein
MKGAKHWFNHLLVAPDGKRFIFLHRWQRPGQASFLTRMFTSNPDGTDLYVVDPHGQPLTLSGVIRNIFWPGHGIRHTVTSSTFMKTAPIRRRSSVPM